MELPLPFDCPETGPVAEAVHAKVEPATLDESETLDDKPLHMVCDAGEAVATGTGLTVIVIVFELTTFETKQGAAGYVSVSETVLPLANALFE